MRDSRNKTMVKTFVGIVLMFFCVCCSVKAQQDNSMLEKLEKRLSAYKDAFRSADYVKAASFASPEMINKIGGEENFAKLVRQFTESTIITLIPSLLDFSKPGEIVSYNKMYVSVITQIIPATTREVEEELKNTYLELNPDFPPGVFKGMDGIFTLPLVAYSKDEGNTWFFTGGNIMGLRVAHIKPDILEKIQIPLPALLFGEGDDKIKLVRKNKRWVTNISEMSTDAGDESIIFTLGENTIDEQTNTAGTGISNDNLDPYIYLEEHPDLLGEVRGNPVQPAADKNIVKSEGRQETSGNASQSVFVTRTSNIYHRPDCSGLKDADLLEFASSGEALEAGGVPCNRCKP